MLLLLLQDDRRTCHSKKCQLLIAYSNNVDELGVADSSVFIEIKVVIHVSKLLSAQEYTELREKFVSLKLVE